MPVNLTDVGLQSITETLATAFNIEKKLESALVLNKTGQLSEGKTFDPTFSFGFSGSGDIPAALAIATDGGLLAIGGITGGKTILTAVKVGFKNIDFNTWEVSGVNYPGAA